MSSAQGRANYVLIWIAAGVFCATVVLNGLAGAGPSTGLGLFVNNVGNISDRYNTDITPAGWAFSIWSIIYTWLTITFIFYVVTIFISNSTGPVYLHPVIASPTYSSVFILNLLLNIAWLFVWDREELIASSVILFLVAGTNIAHIALASRNMALNQHLLKVNQPKLYRAYVAFALNGPGMYATWTVIASLLNLCIALHHAGDVAMINCTRISLSLLLVILVGWFIVENTLLDAYVRFMITPYVVVIWASTAVLYAKKDNPEVPEETKALIKAILGISAVLCALRLCILVYRQVKRPYVAVQG